MKNWNFKRSSQILFITPNSLFTIAYSVEIESSFFKQYHKIQIYIINIYSKVIQNIYENLIIKILENIMT